MNLRGRPLRAGFVFFIFILFIISAVGSSSCDKDPDRMAELTLFHTNDIHSHLRPAKSDPFGLGGIARMKTLLDRLRKLSPASLTVDAGDWSEGSWYFSVDAGSNMLRFFSLLGYDAVCLGNHDFLTGPDQMIQTIERARPSFPVLAANLDAREYSDPHQFRRNILPSFVKTVGGIRVGMIGLTTYELIYDTYLKPIRITDPVTESLRQIAQLRPQVDVLILISHNNFEVNKLLGRTLPGIDAVISGHSHRKTPRAVIVNQLGRGIPVVETGEWGKFLGELKLSVNLSKRKSEIKSYKLHPVSANLEEDRQVSQMIADQDRILSERYGRDVNEIMAHADFELEHSDIQETALGNLAVKAYRASTQADLSLEEISLTGATIAKGPVTLIDLHDVIPHIYNPVTGKEWTLHVWSARGNDLAAVFNVLYTVSGLFPLTSPLGWLSADNVEVIWDPEPLRRQDHSIPAVKLIKIGGRALDPAARYRVTMNDGLLLSIRTANEKLHLGLDLSDVRDSGTEAWRSVVDYASNQQVLRLEDLRVRGHTRTQGFDLAVFSYGINWDGNQISVEVENQGLSAMPGRATVSCYLGRINDPVAYGTPDQVWTEIGRHEIPSLIPDEVVTVRIPWGGASPRQNGLWPLVCKAVLAGEKYTPNNEANKVIRVE